MRSMTKIEEVARAIARNYGDDPEFVNNVWFEYWDDAVAAIEAMREPTIEMIGAGDDAHRRAVTSGFSGMTIEAQIRAKCARFSAGYTAAIDAALNEVEE